MKLDVTRDVEEWLDKVRGDRSRASFILKSLRELMNNDSTRKEVPNEQGLAKNREAVA